MKPAVFHDQAKMELDEALAWYEQRRLGLGRAFQVAVEDAIRRICENPRIGKPYRTTQFHYVLVRRFPYVVFYSEGMDAIRVMAIAHGRRKPGYWKDREI